MKKIKTILPFLLLPLLFSCQNEVVSSSKEEIVSSEMEANASSEETTIESSKEETHGCVLETTDFPQNIAGKYPEDQEIISKDGNVFFISSCMQAGGKGAGCIQMKKEVSFFYNKTKLGGRVSFKLLRNVSSYGDFTGVPTLYQGKEEHPLDNKVTLNMTQDEKWVTYTGEIENYFTLTNESSYAIYIKDFQIN